MSVSLKPSEAVQGGLVDDLLAEVMEATFVLWDYNGKLRDSSPAIKFNLKNEETGEDHEQYWSVGSARDWVPNEDGSALVSVGGAQALRTNSNGVLLMESIVNSGFPEDKIESDISLFKGMVAHFTRVAAPKRTGLTSDVDSGEKKFEATVLVVDEISRLPWEAKPKGKAATKGKAKSAAKAKAPAKAASKDPVDDDLTEQATNFLMAALASGEEVARKELPTLAFKEFKEDPNRNDLVKIVFDEEFLSSGPWNYEGGMVSMG